VILDLDEWMSKKPPTSKKVGHFSQITKCKDDIRILLKKGYTHGAICEYLKEKGVLTRPSNLSRWLKRHKMTREDVTGEGE